MSDTKYIQLTIGGRVYDVPQNEELPVAINFEIEDEDNFEKKKGATAFNITVPATVENSAAMNTFFNPQSEDYSPDNFLKDIQPFSFVANGNELLVGKAMIKSGRKTNVPIDFQVDLYGNNADWAIDNSELTLHDVINPTTHIFDLSTAATPGVIDTSWSYDGTVEDEFFVYAPARYLETFGTDDTVMNVIQLRPALFKYWLLYAGFKRLGYKIVSTFCDSEYFRRMVMPWTWGNFLYIDSSELDVLKFKSLLFASMTYSNGSSGSFSHYLETADNFTIDNETSNGGFDNSGLYDYVGGNTMQFTYTPAQFAIFGSLEFMFHFYADFLCTAEGDAFNNSHLTVDVEWYVNGVLQLSTNVINITTGPLISAQPETVDEYWTSPALNSGDIVTVKLLSGSFVGHNVELLINVPPYGDGAFLELTGFKVPLGGTVDFKKLSYFKNYKWMDFVRGLVDEFNLQINTNSISKTVYIEPTHQYCIGADLVTSPQPGYYNGDIKDWTTKQDLTKESLVENYNDYEQVFKIAMQQDDNDGMYKLIADRSATNLTEALYQFPSRFKKGIKQMENRFFSGVMHYNHEAFKSITGVAPQFICIVPENIANTSNPSANNVFKPKSAYYKGLVDRAIYGGWNLEGHTTYDLPYMFAVNYKSGGESDPILTYCDQKLGTPDTPAKGYGLFKRFFWQRFAIMRHGKKVTSYMALNNSDAMDYLQREFKKIGEGKYQCIKINAFRPLVNDSTVCTFWLWYPITQVDADNTFPSEDSVLNNAPTVNTIDPKYNQLLCLSSDIPN